MFDQEFLQAIIDFESACIYFLVYDLGMAIIGLCNENGTINWHKAKALIGGYEQIRELEQLEKENLQFFTAYAAVGTSCWRYWKYHIDSPNPALSHKHWEMVSLAMAIEKLDKEHISSLVFE